MTGWQLLYARRLTIARLPPTNRFMASLEQVDQESAAAAEAAALAEEQQLQQQK